MSKRKSINDHISETEYLLAKYKLVQEKFPDAIMSYYLSNRYASKTVNSEYTKLEFSPTSWSLTVYPYTELKLSFNGKEEIIRIDSLPRKNRLCSLDWKRDLNGKRTLKVSKFIYNLKKNNFKEDLFNKCRIAVMEFIKNAPNTNLDIKSLEPRLRKLLMFI